MENRTHSRFGIDSHAPPDKGRSMLTPPLLRGIEDWTEDWQRSIFGGYTSQEVILVKVMISDFKHTMFHS